MVTETQTEEPGRARLPGGALFRATPPPVLIVAGMVCRQLGAASAKHLFPLVGPLVVTGLRLVFSAAFLLLVWRSALRVPRRVLALTVACGAVLGAMNVAFYQALERMPLGPTVAIELVGPLVLAACTSRRATDVGCVLLAAAGVLLLTESGGGLAWEGVAFASCAAACWVGYIMLGARLTKATGNGAGLALSLAIGALLVTPAALASNGAQMLDARALVAGCALAVLSSVIPYSLEFRALRRLPPRVFGVLMSLEPAIAALIGFLVASENLHAGQWVAIGLVTSASIGIIARAR